jgi:hypothetical protein
VAEAEAGQTIGWRSGSRIELFIDANVSGRFDDDDAIRNGESGAFGVDGFTTVGALIDNLRVATGEDAESQFGRHGAF